MCGEHMSIGFLAEETAGSSPHVRGALTTQSPSKGAIGIIPACAGSTGAGDCRSIAAGDHPRMCGEHHRPVQLRDSGWGSSPHVRGAPALDMPVVGDGGIIPACAGSTSRTQSKALPRRDHPRMCGEHRAGNVPTRTCWGSSPHVRGARGQAGHGC